MAIDRYAPPFGYSRPNPYLRPNWVRVSSVYENFQPFFSAIFPLYKKLTKMIRQAQIRYLLTRARSI